MMDLDQQREHDVVLSIRGISKTYPGVLALQDVTLAFRAGSVHALVGGNGAGKSTLIKVITGAVVPDGGEIEIGGHSLTSLTPRSAQARGIAVIHQERQIAFDLSIAENVLLGRMPRRRAGGVDWRAARARAGELLRRLGVDVDVRRPVRELGVSELQAVEIARALSADGRVILMDEPTSALSGADVERLVRTIKALREEGVSIIYVSHHLEEIFAVADEVTVLRDGRVVITRPVEGLTTDELVTLMFGRVPDAIAQTTENGTVGSDELLIEAQDLHVGTALAGVSVDVRRGEILCVTGSLGSGRTELARCLSGIQRPDRGSVKVDGKSLRGPRDAIRRGVTFLPEDRKREGLFLELSVVDNMEIGKASFARNPFVSPGRRRRETERLVDRLRVRTRSVSTPVGLLSGGNQQKILLGRWLAVGARVFVFDEPTAGVDIEAKIEIYKLLRELADRGAAIVLMSTDHEEIMLTADRAIVLYRGKIAGELSNDELSLDKLLMLELAAA